METIARRVLAWIVPLALQYLANWIASAQCPLDVTHSTVFCTFWPQIVATVLGVLGYFSIHPNGAHGGPAPSMVSRAFAAVKLAPPVPDLDEHPESQG